MTTSDSDALLARMLRSGEIPFHPAIGHSDSGSWSVRQFDVREHVLRVFDQRWPEMARLRCNTSPSRHRQTVATIYETPCDCGPLFLGMRSEPARVSTVAGARRDAGGARIPPYHEIAADLLRTGSSDSTLWELPLTISCDKDEHGKWTIDRASLLKALRDSAGRTTRSWSIHDFAQRSE